MDRSILIRESVRRIRDHRDSEQYGRERDWSYLYEPEALYERRGVLHVTAVA
jgi:hypothetical protein